MIYEYKGKSYVKVSGYLREVTVTKKGTDFIATPNKDGKKVEIGADMKISKYSIGDFYSKFLEKGSAEKPDNKTESK